MNNILSSISTYFSLCIVILLIAGCSTEVEVNAPKEDVTIIYGILDASKTRHYIRINKSFLGEESATEMAARPGINEYSSSELTAWVHELDDFGNVAITWQLQSIYIKDKEEGAFANDSNKVYFFDAQLDASKKYRIECSVTPEGEETKTVIAETDVIDVEEVDLTTPRIGNTLEGCGVFDRDEIAFVSSSGFQKNFPIEWSTGNSNGKSYKSYFYAYYTTYNSGGVAISEDSIRFDLGTADNDGPVIFIFNTEVFYSRIANEVPDLSDGQGYRHFDSKLQFYLEVASNELATYMSVNRPSTGIIQEKPEYTNVTNGRGIFGSRFIMSTRSSEDLPGNCDGRVLDKLSLKELLESNIAIDWTEKTSSKRFCNEKVDPCPPGE